VDCFQNVPKFKFLRAEFNSARNKLIKRIKNSGFQSTRTINSYAKPNSNSNTRNISPNNSHNLTQSFGYG